VSFPRRLNLSIFKMGGSFEEKELQNECVGYEHFIETGTYHGETSILAGKYFKTVDTIEINQTLYEQSKKTLSSYKNITLHKGDSLDILTRLFPPKSLIENTFFFLDAHLSGMDTVCDEIKIEVPLTQELKLLDKCVLKNCVVCADDVRLWSEDKWGLSPEKVALIFSSHQVIKSYVKNDRFYIVINDKNPSIGEEKIPAKKTIGFYLDHFTFRGTNSAVYDYAVYNKKLLGNESIIIFAEENKSGEKESILNQYRSENIVTIPAKTTELEGLFKSLKLSALYTISRNSGINESGKQTRPEIIAAQNIGLKCIVHCVLEMGNISSAKGTSFIGVSNSVAKGGDVLPHIVILPELKTDYRSFLNIPSTAIVYGRHGGCDTFDIPFVKKAIEKIVQVRKDIYFIFAGEVPNILRDVKPHPQILFISPFYDKYTKRKFINTCDYMIHGGKLGESFGLSCLEFDYCGKGVLTVAKEFIPDEYDKKISVYNTSHLEEVQNLLVYKDYISLVGFFINNKRNTTGRVENKKFSPEYVMKIFSGFL
jgi:hypothetical protein